MRRALSWARSLAFMWECPDLFELDGELILVCCPQGVPADGWRYRNPHQCVWFPIEADWEAPSFKIVGKGMPPDGRCRF